MLTRASARRQSRSAHADVACDQHSAPQRLQRSRVRMDCEHDASAWHEREVRGESMGRGASCRTRTAELCVCDVAALILYINTLARTLGPCRAPTNMSS